MSLVSLDMSGHIDTVFKSVTATRTAKSGGEYTDGIWVAGTETETTHAANVQPLNNKDIDFLTLAGERIRDSRKVYINDGTMASISESDTWTFPNVDGTFKTYSLDNRPWRNYCKFYAIRLDE